MDKNITLKRIFLSRTIIIVLLVFIIITSIVFFKPFTIVSANTVTIVSGKVTDTDNTDLSGVNVKFYTEEGVFGGEETTADDGTYKFEIPSDLNINNYTLRFTYGDKNSLNYNGLVYELNKITGSKTGYNQKADAQNNNFNFAFVLPEGFGDNQDLIPIYNRINNIKNSTIPRYKYSKRYRNYIWK